MERFLSGHTTYDRIANGEGGTVLTGNVHADNMFGFHLRAFSDTECNGLKFELGCLQAYDLKGLEDCYPCAYRRVIAYVRAKDGHFRTKQGWVYVIRHPVRRPGGRIEYIVHGVLITTYEHKLLFRLDRESVTPQGRTSRKSRLVMDAISPRLAKAA